MNPTDSAMAGQGAEASPKIQLQLFGGFTLRCAVDDPVSLSLRKAQALIAYLAVSKAGCLSRDQAATLLWPNSTQATALQSLRQARHTLMRELTAKDLSFLSCDRRDIRLDRSGLDVDALEFTGLVATADEASLTRAAELYTGEFLAGLEVDSESFEEWLQPMRGWFREQAEVALGKLLALQEQAGNSDGAVNTAKRILMLDPLREDMHRWLMRSFSARGQRSSALAVFEVCREVLRRELSVEPELETRELYQMILAQAQSDSLQAGEDEPFSAHPVDRPEEDDERARTAVKSEALSKRLLTAIGALDGVALQVAQTTAVAGGLYSPKLLAAVTEQPAQRIEAVLVDLRSAGLLQRAAAGKLAGMPRKVRATVLDRLLPTHRKHLHHAIAVALEEGEGSYGPELAHEIAQHYRNAGRVLEAIPHLLNLARTEIERGNLDLAEVQCRNLLRDLVRLSAAGARDRLVAEAELTWACLAELRGELEPAERLLSHVWPTLKRSEDANLMAAALLAKSRLTARRGDLAGAARAIRQAAGNHNDAGLRGYWLPSERFAHQAVFLTQEDGVIAGNAPLVARPQWYSAGPRSLAVDGSALEALCHAKQGSFAAAYAASEESRRQAAALPDTICRMASLQAFAVIQIWNDEGMAALETLDEAQDLARRRGDLLRQ
ncbi:MAG TPA: BTAD domain-containing putative transcriptional regulator, partial [Woeseiaceae bacterium]